MKAYGWFKEALDKVKDSFEYKLATQELHLTSRISKIMDSKGVSRSELAARLDVKKPSISHLLNNGSNVTLKRMLTIAEALDCDLVVDFKERMETVAEEMDTIRIDKKRRPLSFVDERVADDYQEFEVSERVHYAQAEP